MPEPGGTGRVRVVVHGPAGAVEQVPAAEHGVRGTGTGREIADASDSWSGGEGTPAASVDGTPASDSVESAQARNERQASLWRASVRSSAHSVSPGPHAPLPGFSGSTTVPESRIAAASRSRSTPVWFAKAGGDRP